MAKRKAASTRRKSTPSKRVKRAAPKSSVFKRKSRFLIPWPYIVLIIMCVGVLLAGWTFQAKAADIHATAKVSAPALTDPAIITSPADGTHFSDIPITVSGTCPDDSYVKIYRNDVFSGSVVCDNTTNTFSLQTDLFPGANVLRARVFNVTDDEGPTSPTITVYYDVLVTPPPPPSEEGSTPGSAGSTSPGEPSTPVTPFIIKTEFDYTGYTVGQIAQWKLDASGGYPPYAFNIDWGDGTNSVISRKKAGPFTIDHIYKKRGLGDKNIFVIKVKGSDSANAHAFLQFFLVVNPSKLGGIVANTLPKSPLNNNWLLLAWPAYLVMILMVTSFWLGERQEVINLKRRGMLRSRRT